MITVVRTTEKSDRISRRQAGKEDDMDSVRFLLNDNWKFHLGEAEDAWFKGYDDSSWESVTLLHDWSVSQPFSKEYSSGTGYAAGGMVLTTILTAAFLPLLMMAMEAGWF